MDFFISVTSKPGTRSKMMVVIRQIRGYILFPSFTKQSIFLTGEWCSVYGSAWNNYWYPSCRIKKSFCQTDSFLARTSYCNIVVPPQNDENRSIMGYCFLVFGTLLSIVLSEKVSVFWKLFLFERSRHVVQLSGSSHFQAVVSSTLMDLKWRNSKISKKHTKFWPPTSRSCNFLTRMNWKLRLE
jgi:hypothetical protein